MLRSSSIHDLRFQNPDARSAAFLLTKNGPFVIMKSMEGLGNLPVTEARKLTIREVEVKKDGTK